MLLLLLFQQFAAVTDAPTVAAITSLLLPITVTNVPPATTPNVVLATTVETAVGAHVVVAATPALAA